MLSSDIVSIAPVIPVVVLEDPDAAVPLARALADGGIGVIELTLRTPQALAAIHLIAAEVPDVVVGAGTVLTGEDVAASVSAGAQFLVSPGTSPQLWGTVEDAPIPFLPGVSTPSEALLARERGYVVQKFFPAEASGGVRMLSSLSGPLPDLRFCPTGGIGPRNVADYLALDNVDCVGGSWIVPAGAVRARDWATITTLATEAAALRG